MRHPQLQYHIGDRVLVLSLGSLVAGIISRIRYDEQGDEIYTVTLDRPQETASGFYYARHLELEPLAR